MTYSEKLKDPRWQKKRLKILERDNWTCVVTGETDQTLHVHHRRYFGNPWDAPDEDLETICEWVHDVISDFDKPLRSAWKHASIHAVDILRAICKAIQLEANTYFNGDFERAIQKGVYWHFNLVVWMEMTRLYGEPRPATP